MNSAFEKRTPSLFQGAAFHGFMGFPPMFHTHGELIYVQQGCIETTVDGETHTLRAGEVCVLFPYLTHSYTQAPDANGLLLLFDPSITAFTNTLLNKKPVQYYADGKLIAPLLERLITMLHQGKVKTANGYLNAILGELLEMLALEDSDGSAGSTTVKILEYCTEHFTEDITVKNVANALYVSESYVSKIFSNKLKYGFREYINFLRINKAKTLLHDPGKRVVDIMFECGFRNQSSFNRVFKNICGISPKEYKTHISNN